MNMWSSKPRFPAINKGRLAQFRKQYLEPRRQLSVKDRHLNLSTLMWKEEQEHSKDKNNLEQDLNFIPSPQKVEEKKIALATYLANQEPQGLLDNYPVVEDQSKIETFIDVINKLEAAVAADFRVSSETNLTSCQDDSLTLDCSTTYSITPRSKETRRKDFQEAFTMPESYNPSILPKLENLKVKHPCDQNDHNYALKQQEVTQSQGTSLHTVPLEQTAFDDSSKTQKEPAELIQNIKNIISQIPVHLEKLNAKVVSNIQEDISTNNMAQLQHSEVTESVKTSNNDPIDNVSKDSDQYDEVCDSSSSSDEPEEATGCKSKFIKCPNPCECYDPEDKERIHRLLHNIKTELNKMLVIGNLHGPFNKNSMTVKAKSLQAKRAIENVHAKLCENKGYCQGYYVEPKKLELKKKCLDCKWSKNDKEETAERARKLLVQNNINECDLLKGKYSHQKEEGIKCCTPVKRAKTILCQTPQTTAFPWGKMRLPLRFGPDEAPDRCDKLGKENLRRCKEKKLKEERLQQLEDCTQEILAMWETFVDKRNKQIAKVVTSEYRQTLTKCKPKGKRKKKSVISVKKKNACDCKNW